MAGDTGKLLVVAGTRITVAEMGKLHRAADKAGITVSVLLRKIIREALK